MGLGVGEDRGQRRAGMKPEPLPGAGISLRHRRGRRMKGLGNPGPQDVTGRLSGRRPSSRVSQA